MTSLRWIGACVFVFIAGAAVAQEPAKPLAFEVVSIRKSEGGPQHFAATPDGYQLRNMPMMVPILTSYIPQSNGAQLYNTDDQKVGFPDWINNDTYDIDAKVSPTDLPDWHDAQKQPEMLRAMLQNMLTDRLKLKVHREQRNGNVYELIVGKNGPKFKATDPAVHHTGMITMPDGTVIGPERTQCAVITHYWNISMSMVASFVLNTAGRPVLDKTGLTGRYDLQRDIPNAACVPAGSEPPPPTSAFTIADEFGLKLVPAKGPVETLVIDHVEEPAAN